MYRVRDRRAISDKIEGYREVMEEGQGEQLKIGDIVMGVGDIFDYTKAHCWFKRAYMRNQGASERNLKQRDIREWGQ